MPKPRNHYKTWEPTPNAHPQPLPLACETDLVNPLLCVGDIMTTDFRSCAPWDPISLAAEMFFVSQCGFLPVIETVRPIGVLTDRDLALALHRHGSQVFNRHVRDIMSSPVVTITADASLDALINRLGKSGVRRLPVVNKGGRIEGVVSITDLLASTPERGIGKALTEIIRGRTSCRRYQNIVGHPGRCRPAPSHPEIRRTGSEELACTN